MKRSQVEKLKQELHRLLDRIDVMERCSGWNRYTAEGNKATSKPHPDDEFESGAYVAAVKRACIDVGKEVVEVRR